MTSEQLHKAWQELHEKSPDEIERHIIAASMHVSQACHAIAKALPAAGDTTNARPWYSPTGASVHALKWTAKATNGMGMPQIAIFASLFYGMIDIFGFSESLRIAMAMKRAAEKKAAPHDSPGAAQPTQTEEVKPDGERDEDSGLPEPGL